MKVKHKYFLYEAVPTLLFTHVAASHINNMKKYIITQLVSPSVFTWIISITTCNYLCTAPYQREFGCMSWPHAVVYTVWQLADPHTTYQQSNLYTQAKSGNLYSPIQHDNITVLFFIVFYSSSIFYRHLRLHPLLLSIFLLICL